MNLPVKHRSVYTSFDENDKLINIFKVKDDRVIEEFINISEDTSSIIILPALDNQEAEHPSQEELTITSTSHIYQQYLHGNVEIGENAFTGIKKATIVVPNKTSIYINWNSFDEGAIIDFITPPNMSLKEISHINRSRGYGDEYQISSWILLADRNLEVDYSTNFKCYNSEEYNDDTHPERVQLSINQQFCVVNGEIIDISKVSEEESSM